VHDLTPAADLLHGEEVMAYGNAGYQGIAKRAEMSGKTTKFQVTIRPAKCRALPDTPDEKLQNLIGIALA
jgi:IS5 family transposase